MPLKLRSIAKGVFTADPETGSGNGSFNVSGEQNNGRSQRSGSFIVSANRVTPVELPVKQAGRPEFIEVEATKAIAKEGGNITITGESNSASVNITLGTGDLAITVPAQITANSVLTNNGAAIEGDPGNTNKYTFSVTFAVPENITINEKTIQVIATAGGGQTDTCVLTQSAGDPYLTINPTEVNLTWKGTAVSVAVNANAPWTIA